MSTSEENTEIIIPCVLITSCDTGFKEEELIKREFNEPERQCFGKLSYVKQS